MVLDTWCWTRTLGPASGNPNPWFTFYRRKSADVQREATMGFQPGEAFRIQDDRQNGVARLALRGELDLATAPKLNEHLILVEQDGVLAVLLDLRDLTFVDSMGLQTLLKAKIRAAENGHRFALIGANQQVKRILYVTAIQGILDEQEGVQLLARFASSRIS